MNQKRTRTEPARARTEPELNQNKRHIRYEPESNWAGTRKEPEQNQPKPELNQNLTRTSTTVAMTPTSIGHETNQTHPAIQLLKRHDRTKCFLFCQWFWFQSWCPNWSEIHTRNAWHPLSLHIAKMRFQQRRSAILNRNTLENQMCKTGAGGEVPTA